MRRSSSLALLSALALPAAASAQEIRRADVRTIPASYPYRVERIETPPGLDPEILVRGDGRLTAAQVRRAGEALRGIFSDPRVKEAVATPRGVRVVRQAAEGARGAHLLLRQSDFPISAVAPDSVLEAVADADALREALDWAERQPARLTA